MTKTDLSTEALQRHQEFTELQHLQAENARLEANMATLRDALKHILDLSTSECIALRAADIDINLNINEIRIAARDALDAARKVVEE